MITTRQVEVWSGAMKQVRLEEPDIPYTQNMTIQQWNLLSARACIKAGLIEDLDPNIDIDEVPVWRVEQIGEAWRAEYNEAMTIPKKKSSLKSPVTFSTKAKLPAI